MDAQALAGKVFGDCLLQRVIGVGTLGVVYQSMQSSPLRQVAVKVLTRATTLEPQEQVAFLEKFHDIMACVATLQHPRIVPIYEYGVSGNLAYVVMAEVQGETLEQLLSRSGALDLQQALDYVEQIAEALDYAHARGITHQDLKPATIFVMPDQQALVADFLLTAMLSEEATAPLRLSRPDLLDYMSPELVAVKAVDGRADIYSLGAILYRMITGAPPFQGKTLMKVAARHLMAAPPSPLVLRPDLPVAVEQVILKALEKHPADRYATAADFASAFRHALQNKEPDIHAVLRPAPLISPVPHLPESQELPGSRSEGADTGTRPFITRGLSRLPRSPQSRRSDWQAAAVTSLADDSRGDGNTGEKFYFGQNTPAEQPLISPANVPLDEKQEAVVKTINTQARIQAAVARKNPVTPAEHITGEPLRQTQALADRLQAQHEQLTGKITRELPPVGLMAAAQEETGVTGTLRLQSPVKIVSIPVVGQPGQFVTGIVPTQPLQQLYEEPAPMPVPAKRALQRKKKLALLALLVLLVLLGSVGFWFTRGFVANPTGKAEPGQTSMRGTPDLGATTTARALATLQAATILYDPLSQNIHNWPENSTGTILYQFKDGAYYISNNDPSRIAPAILQSEALNGPFAYTLTMDEVRGDTTSFNNEFGMIIRFTEQQKNGKQVIRFYSFEVLNKTGGEYQFWKYDNSIGTGSPWKQLATHPLGSEFHQGLGTRASNTITIQVNGGNFTLIVNGKKVWSVSDGTLTSGSVGMLVNLQGAEVAFSNLRLTTM